MGRADGDRRRLCRAARDRHDPRPGVGRDDGRAPLREARYATSATPGRRCRCCTASTSASSASSTRRCCRRSTPALDAGRRLQGRARRQRRAVRERGDPDVPARPARRARRAWRARRLVARASPCRGAVNAAFVMSEAAAYPVFLWAVLALPRRDSREPSPRARRASRSARSRSRSSRGRSSSSSPPCSRSRRSSSTGRAAAAAAPRAGGRLRGRRSSSSSRSAALGESHRLLGDYGVTATQGSVLPAIALKSAAAPRRRARGRSRRGPVPARRGLGVLDAARAARSQLRAFAALTALALPLLALETGLVRRALRRAGRDARPLPLLPRAAAPARDARSA